MAIESLVISHQTAPVVVGHNVESGRFGADSNLVVGRKSKPVPEAPMVDIDREPIISSSELEAKIAELNEALASRNHAIVFSRDSTTLEVRFPNQKKDVVVMAGDGGLIDIGFQGLMHSWFRKEKFTTIMLDNEVYGNTGGQESGMTNQGKVMKMAPRGKFGEKIDALGLAKVAGVDYIARLAPTNPARVARTVRRAIMVAREVGHSYIQAYTSCNIEYSIPTPDVMKDAFEIEKERYGFEEIISPAAKAYLDEVEKKPKKKKSD